MDRHYGEWNAVYVHGEWRLIDVLWASCDPKDPGDGRGRFRCDERFFLTDPKELIFTHFAETPQWQLLEVPQQAETFQDGACLRSRYFEFGMQVLSHPFCEIQCSDGELDVVFGVRPQQAPKQRFTCYISYFDQPGTRRQLTSSSNNSVPIFIHKPTDSSISVKIRFPEKGEFRIEIVGKETVKDSVWKQYDWVAEYKVIVENPAPRGFPKMDPIGWGPGREIDKIGLAPFNYTSGIIVAKNAQTKLRFKIMDTNLVQNMKIFIKVASTYDNDFVINAVSDKFEVDLNIMTFFLEAPPFGEYTLKMFARNVRGNANSLQREEMNICNYLLISDIQTCSSPLAILTERTEIAEEPVQSDRTTRGDTAKSGRSIDPLTETTESLVSASNVVLKNEDFRNSPTVPAPDVLKSPNVCTNAQEHASAGSSTLKEEKQTFVRVDADLQEIPEIPLDVVKPVVAENENQATVTREMKVVSTDRVVPLKQTGGEDGSIKLIPANSKLKRPSTGRLRGERKREGTKFFTATARVKSGKDS